MIIGAILETSQYDYGGQTNVLNGVSTLIFYTMRDAIAWAELQSEYMLYGSGGTPIYTLTSVIDTETSVKRWWYNGTEFTA